MNSKEVKLKANELNILLWKKLEKMNRIFEITELQRKDLESNDGEDLNNLLELRQAAMNEVDEIDKKFLSGFSELKEVLNVKDLSGVSAAEYPVIANLKTKISEINDLTNKILVTEKENELLIAEKIESVQREISLVRKGKQGIKAYGTKIQSNDGYYIDKKK